LLAGTGNQNIIVPCHSDAGDTFAILFEVADGEGHSWLVGSAAAHADNDMMQCYHFQQKNLLTILKLCRFPLVSNSCFMIKTLLQIASFCCFVQWVAIAAFCAFMPSFLVVGFAWFLLLFSKVSTVWPLGFPSNNSGTAARGGRTKK
jgi:hypothetical protein